MIRTDYVRAIALALCSILPIFGANQLGGQTLPGKNLSVTVSVHLISMSNDTTIISYSVRNASTSLEHLMSFTVYVPTTAAHVTSPGSATDWLVQSSYRGRSVAAWTSLATVAPGDSMPTISFRAQGLPGIATAWYQGDSLFTLDSNDSTTVIPDYDPVADLSVAITTVGIDAAPTTIAALTARLQAQSDSACVLGWITSSPLCSTLHTLAASDDYGSISQFGASLDSARSAGSAVTDAAYWLLKPNATYALAHITPPPLAVYITVDTASSSFTAHVSGGTPSYSFLWEWCAIDCGDALRALPGGGVKPKEVEHGWHDVGSYKTAACWTMSGSTLRATVTDATTTQVVAYFTVPLMVHDC
jgi:hypothetical protein